MTEQAGELRRAGVLLPSLPGSLRHFRQSARRTHGRHALRSGPFSVTALSESKLRPCLLVHLSLHLSIFLAQFPIQTPSKGPYTSSHCLLHRCEIAMEFLTVKVILFLFAERQGQGVAFIHLKPQRPI